MTCRVPGVGMTGWPDAPVLLEINTWPWLAGLRRRGLADTLAAVPGEAWDRVAGTGVDAVWLMGVWERSPAGLAIAREDAGLMGAMRAALPDLTDDDIVGSPYCVRRYVVDARLGGPDGLAAARAELARRGVRLILDYVPNHVAPDHPAVAERPELFVPGTAEDLAREPGAWLPTAHGVIARGRDPYFPAWPDVVQLNAFHPGMRAASVDTLTSIAAQCDGARCDLAMLLMNDVFARTWGGRVGPAPAEEFWPLVIGELRARYPDFVLMAEAYWDTEHALQQQGFDFCYDKRLYDRLAHEGAGPVREHLGADPGYQRRLVRFLENHDEPRAATEFPPDRYRAAAVTIATVPGATLWHDGQFEGRRAHLPVFLGRYPDEPVDEELRLFHARLLPVAAEARRGTWTLLDARGWADNTTAEAIMAWAWHDAVPHHLVVVNGAGHAAQGLVRLPWPELAGHSWRLVDPLSGRVFEREGDELCGPGLYVDLPAWGGHLLRITPA